MADNEEDIFADAIKIENVAHKTLLDEFAMAALTGMLARYPRNEWSQDEIVKESWSFAHAMMAERSKKREG